MTKQELKAKIDKLENGIKSKATPSNLIAPLKAQKAKLEKELKEMESAEKKAVKTKKVSKVAEKIKAAKKSVAKKTPAKAPAKEERKKDNIARDGDRKSLPSGKRISKNGKVYYENRVNRSDKQTSVKPYLAKGGYNYKPSANLKEDEYQKLYKRLKERKEKGENLDSREEYAFSKAEYILKTRGLLGKEDKMADGGEIDWGADLGGGFSVGNDVYITDPKSLFQGKTGFVIGVVGRDLLVTILDNGNERSVVVSKKGVEKLDAPEYAKGGKIKNQYEGKTAKEVWDNLSKEQRQHFLYDHKQSIEDYRGEEYGELKSKEIIAAYNSDWDKLDKNIKNRFDNHVREGQYAHGGYVIFEGHDHYNDKPSYQVISKDEDNYYEGEFHDNREDAEKELNELKNKDMKYANGGKIYGEQSIKDFYINTYPTDDLGQKINREATFDGLNKVLDCNIGVYEYIGVGDSLVRERVFEKLAEIEGVSYDVIYDKWLASDYADGGYMAKGGQVPAHFGSGKNIEVFGYETKHFDICGTAVKEFEAAVDIIKDSKELEKESLAYCAKYVDNLFGIEKVVVEGGIGGELNFSHAVSDIMSAATYNFRAGMAINLYSFVPQHLMEIALRLAKAEKGGFYALGGMTAGRWYKDKSGEEFKFIGRVDSGANKGRFLFTDGKKSVYKDLEEFEGGKPKETKLFGFFEDGGSVAEGNYEMLMSNIKAIKHHAEELAGAVTPDTEIEAWVLSKSERAETDLSDITHYLDGLKMEKGGYMAEGGLVVKSDEDLREVAKYMAKAVKKRADLKDLVYYFEQENNYDYKYRVKIWDEMNVWEMKKTEENIYKVLKAIVEANEQGGVMADGGQLGKETITLKSYNIYGKEINSGDVIVDYDNKTIELPSGKTYKVENDYKYTIKVLKSKIKASGGINGLVKFLKEINTSDSPFNPSFTNQLINGFDKYAEGGELNSIKEEYLKNEDENAHSENVVLLAKHFGTKEDLAEAKRILALHEKEGHLSSENGKKRQQLHLKLIDKATKEMAKEGIEFEKGGYMAKGGIYSSDSLYILKVSKDGKEVGEERFRAKNEREAREMGEDFEEKYKSKFGGDLSFSVKEAESKMAKGGMTRKGGQSFEVNSRKFFYHKDDGNVYDSNHRLYAGSYDTLEQAKKSLEKNFEDIKKGTFFKEGGKVKFADKVKAVQESLLKRKKVAPQVQKDYGKTYNKAEAKESAQRIVGSRMAQLKEKMAKKKMAKGGTIQDEYDKLRKIENDSRNSFYRARDIDKWYNTIGNNYILKWEKQVAKLKKLDGFEPNYNFGDVIS